MSRVASIYLVDTFIASADTLVMPLNTRSSKSTQPPRTQKRKHGQRGARDSEDEVDDTPVNTQAINEDDDLDQTNNGVGHGYIFLVLQITPDLPRN